MKPSSSVFVLAALALAGMACATNPVTGGKEISLMSEAQEIQLGQQSDPEVRKEMGVYDDPALQQYVQDVGMRLARVSQRPDLPWHFAVVDVPAVNAFALPGGYICITRGLLAHLDTEAEMAGVLGHEIGHVTARHSARAYTRSASVGAAVTSIFFPAAEPYAAADQTGLGVPNGLSTHPQPEDRVVKVAETVRTLEATRAASEWTINRDAYRQRLNGLVFGDTWQGIAGRTGGLIHAPELAVLNGYAGNSEPPPASGSKLSSPVSNSSC
jgi:predicted Zn-dependent protease